MVTRPPIIIRDGAMRERVIQLVAGLNLEKPWIVTIKPYNKRRSLSQNALMWKWLDEVAEHVSQYTGHDSDEIHTFFKAKFLQPKEIRIKNEFVRHRSTKNLTTVEMSEYMQKIEAFVTSELGILLPHPDDLAMVG